MFCLALFKKIQLDWDLRLIDIFKTMLLFKCVLFHFYILKNGNILKRFTISNYLPLVFIMWTENKHGIIFYV